MMRICGCDLGKEAMKNDDNMVAGGTTQYMTYHTLKHLKVPPDIQCFCSNNIGWIHQDGLDPLLNDQIINNP